MWRWGNKRSINPPCSKPSRINEFKDMTIKIPKKIDYKGEELDALELTLIKKYKPPIDNWLKFRKTIHTGNESANLISANNNKIPEEVKSAYIEMAKSHYEVITSIGAIYMSYDLIKMSSQVDNSLCRKKSIKDFYFHIGCVLDNLARLIYIVNNANAPFEKNKYNQGFKRHYLDWRDISNEIKEKKYQGYLRLVRSRQLEEIINIRNNMAHNWAPPAYSLQSNGEMLWPVAVRKGRNFYWFYSEKNSIRKRYKKWVPVSVMIENDLNFIVYFQERIFQRLIKDIIKFENNHNIKIT